MSGFLSRWALRKQALRETAVPQEQPPVPVGPDAPPAEAAPAAPDPDAIARLIAELPPVETITASTDIRPFLQSFVPAALKNAALRRAWAADPVISTHLDVARDYAWDFNSGPGPAGFYPTLSKEVSEKSLELLTGRTPAAPEPQAEAEPVERPSEPPPPLPEVAEPAPEPDSAPQNTPPKHPVKVSHRHGSALPG